MKTPQRIGTLCIQAGHTPKVGEPRILPIIQGTTFKYDDIEQVNRVMTLKEFGFKYTRTGNPTVAGFENKLNALEGGAGAVATASGQAANLLAITNICRAGDHVLAASTLYGGSFTLLHTTLPKFGIEATFFDPEASAAEIKKLLRPNTRLLFGETIGNPGLNILDFSKLSGLARSHGIPFVVDNTLASPFLCSPLTKGANIVTHSASKYIDGHATSIGGAVVDGGNFDWANGKFPDFTEPDLSYNGVRYTRQFPQAPFLYKARAQFLRDFGGCLSPLNAFLFNLGLETLHLRMPRHSDNALALARHLSRHPQVAWVNYPGLDPVGKKRIRRYFNARLGSGILCFGLRGDRRRIRRFIKALQVAALVVHIGDARTGVLHPASSTPTLDHVSVDTRRYLNLAAQPARLKNQLHIAISEHAFLPQVENLQTDWVSTVATPAFKLIRQQRGALEAFASIGTGVGLDALAAIETLGVTRVGITDVHEDVVSAAADNITRNLFAAESVRIEAGYGDLLSPLEALRPRYDVIYENLPNVPVQDASLVSRNRLSSSHVPPRSEQTPTFAQQHLLTLHFLAIRQSREFLKPDGALLSTLGGRVPLKVFVELVSLAGLKGDIFTYTWKNQTDPDLILRNYVEKQAAGNGPFHFYRVESLAKVFANVNTANSGEQAFELEAQLAAERLTPQQALDAHLRGEKIGHTVAVLRSRPL